MTYHDLNEGTVEATTSAEPSSSPSSSSLGEKGQQAKEKASEIVGQAQSAAGEVATTAKDQARVLTEEAKYQAHELMTTTRPAAVGASRAASAARFPRASEHCRPDAGAQGRTSTGRGAGCGVDGRDPAARPPMVRPPRVGRRRRCATRPVEPRPAPTARLPRSLHGGRCRGRPARQGCGGRRRITGQRVCVAPQEQPASPGGTNDVLPPPVTAGPIADPVTAGAETMP